MYTMKQVCIKTEMTYETLKFYCNEGLVPNVKRDNNNHRIFDDQDVAWIESLRCLKHCGMSIHEMKSYLDLCLLGKPSIPDRKMVLAKKKDDLLITMNELQKAIDYIDWKQGYYDDLWSGKLPYTSNLIKTDE